jgi:protein gp37
MADKSSIEWTDATWSPFRGCTRISPGCQNCYAERMAARNLLGHRSPTTGNPFANMTQGGPRWTGKVELIESQMNAPLRWRRPRRIFVNSMSDTFHERVSVEWIERVFAVASVCQQHTFIMLTKRSKRLREYHAEDLMGRGARHRVYNRAYALGAIWQRSPSVGWPLRNIHMGISAEDQPRFDERVEDLRATPAAVRWLSMEPLLGPIDLAGRLDGIHWVVVGGESGPGARPVQKDWVRSIRNACVEAGVPFFFKQWGEYLPPMTDGAITDNGQVLNCSDVPVRIGKSRAGASLDGREWRELPEAAR